MRKLHWIQSVQKEDIMKNKYEIVVHLDEQGFTEKPHDEIVARISNRITKRRVKISLEDFSHYVGERGVTFARALFKGKRNTDFFEEQVLFAVDIDKGLSYQEFMKRSEDYNILPFLVYDTFSSTSKQEKFRAVYLMETVIEKKKLAELFNVMLIKVFPESDKSCKDVTRMFYGGKGIKYFDERNVLNIERLVVAFHTEMKERDRKNHRRNIEKLAGDYGIACKDGRIQIYRKDLVMDEKKMQGADILGGMAVEYGAVKKMEKKEIKGEKEKNNSENSPNFPILRIDKDKLPTYCYLYKKHLAEHLHHNLKFLLATNLQYIKGGKTLFMNGIEEEEIESRKNWEMEWTQIKSYGYKPQSCMRGGCPYVNRCKVDSLYSKLTWKIIPLRKKVPYITLEDAQNELRQYLHEAVEAKDRGIHLIKAQTALGKTQAYCELACEKSDQAFMFVVPTLDLQDEIVKRLEAVGSHCIKTVSCIEKTKELDLSIYNELIMLYDSGQGDKVKGRIQEYLESNGDELSEITIEEIKRCLNQQEKLDGSCNVVTTHKMFLNLPLKILEQYEIIVDEDILMSVIKDNGSVSRKKITEALDAGIFSGEAEKRLKMLQNLEPEKAVKLEPLRISELSDKNMERFGDLVVLLGSQVFYYEENTQDIRYFNPMEIPKVKTIVLSATLNEKIWKDFCKNRRVRMNEVGTVQYRGKLMQFTYHSMSRECIRKLDGQKVKEAIKEITGVPEEQIITFKKFMDESEIHFGKTEGFDKLKGKNLAIIGTPHYIVALYKMVGRYLDYDTSKKLCRQRVENSNYSFNLMTFSDAEMRNLQMYILESELEQAVGRARLLRYDTVVWVFSNFPLRQAELNQEDYLKD